MKLEMSFTAPVVLLKSGEEIEGEAAHLYIDSNGVPQLLQILGKGPVTIPWCEVKRLSHA